MVERHWGGNAIMKSGSGGRRTRLLRERVREGDADGKVNEEKEANGEGEGGRRRVGWQREKEDAYIWSE